MSRRRVSRVAVAFAMLVVLAGAFLTGGCCAFGPHHQRRLGPDQTQFVRKDDKALGQALGRPVLVFNEKEGVPAVLLLHEIGGVTPETLELAARLSQEGYTVYVPVLFGEVGVRKPLGLVSLCLGHDFNCVKSSVSPPAHELLTKLLPAIAERHSKIGVIGMCLTGNFPLLLMQHPAVNAAVLSQPALPFFRKGATGVSTGELTNLRKALEDKDARAAKKTKLLYFRYLLDCISPPERLEALDRALPGRVIDGVFPSCDSEHHAVLTDSLTETPEAWQCMTSYLGETLQGKAPAPGACTIEKLTEEALSNRCGQAEHDKKHLKRENKKRTPRGC
jgi:dienelactone hydrolase